MAFVAIITILGIVNAAQKAFKVQNPIFKMMQNFMSQGNQYIICNFNTFLGNLFIFGAFVEAGTAMLAARGMESMLLNYSKFFLIALVEWATMSFGIYNLKMISKSWKLLGCTFWPKGKKVIIVIGLSVLAFIANFGFHLITTNLMVQLLIWIAIFGVLNISWIMIKVHVITGFLFIAISLFCTSLLLYFTFAGAEALTFLDGEPVPIFGGYVNLDLNKVTNNHDSIASIVVILNSVMLGVATLVGYNKGLNQDYIKNIYGIHNYVPSFKHAISELVKEFSNSGIVKDKLSKAIDDSNHKSDIKLWIIKAEDYRYKTARKGSTFRDIGPSYDKYYKDMQTGYLYITEEMKKFTLSVDYNPLGFKHKI